MRLQAVLTGCGFQVLFSIVGCSEVSGDHCIPLAVTGWVETAVSHPRLGVSASHGVGCGGSSDGSPLSAASVRDRWIPGIPIPEQVMAEVPIVLAGMQSQGPRASAWP